LEPFQPLLFREDGVQPGVWMLCLTAISFVGIGGCQRPVVTPPAPIWREQIRPTVPEPIPLNPPTTAIPPMIGNPWKPSVAARDWKYIVIHHTASSSGSVESIHAYHLTKKDKNGKPWKGIGYHFVIGNGNGMGDGEIEPTFRWKQQTSGAHAGSLTHPEYNDQGIGICLVGNFEVSHPSAAQLSAVKQLVGVLKREYSIKSSNVIGHRDVIGKDTACPGKFFPMSQVAQSEAMPFFTHLDATPISN